MKGNNLVQIVLNYLRGQRIIVGLSLVLLGLLVVPFWKNNSLEIYDAPGHISLVWYLKEFLWPSFSGWNPFILSGWPQGIFYPSLFHWVSASLGFLIGIDTAIKLIISIAILALPFSIFFAVKNTTPDKKYWLPITFFILLFLALLPNFLGIGFRGLFQIGLIPNFVSTPILFLFIGLLHSRHPELDSGSKIPDQARNDTKRVFWLAITLSILILTHLVAGIVAILYLVTYLKISWFIFNRDVKFKSVLLLGMITALLTSFFWIPFLINFSLTSVSVHVSSYFLVNIILALVSAIIIWVSYRFKLKESLILSAFALFLLVLAVVDSWLISSQSNSFLFYILYPLHIYRFQPYAYLALILAFGVILPKFPVTFSVRIWKIGTMFIFLILLVYLFARSPIISGSKVTIEDTQLGGRFLESFRRTESDPLLYSAQTNLVMQNPEDNVWAYGLFTDSTPNGPYLGSLIRSLRLDAYPEGEGRFIETKIIDRKNIQQALDIFGIKHLLNLSEVAQGEEIGKWESNGQEKIYATQQVGQGKLAEVMKLNPIPVSGDFDEKVEEWWSKDGEWSTLPFQITNSHPELDSGSKIPDQVGNDIDLEKFDLKTEVTIVEQNKDWTKIKLNIDSESPQPVLIKFSYFPWWFAQQDGREVQIYRAAPNQMLFFANGEVDLEFQEPFWLNLLYLISAATFLAVIFQLLKKRGRSGQ